MLIGDYSFFFAVAEGHEGEQPQEKKSVLGRVKARARKIRDSLTKQGPSNDQDHSHDEEDNDEDDKEMVQDPEVPGAPSNICFLNLITNSNASLSL